MRARQNSEFVSPRTFAVGGGKGGIGKTIITACLGMAMAEQGRRVILIDADLGGANLHALLGMSMPGRTLFDFFSRQVEQLQDVVMLAPFPNLRIICGAPGTLGIANIKYWEKHKLMRHIRQLDADDVIIDIGAGMSFNEIDFFNLADTGIVVANPEPPSIQECFNFMKTALLRKLRVHFSTNDVVARILDAGKNPEFARDTRLISQLRAAIAAQDAKAVAQFDQLVKRFSPMLLLNQVYNFDEKIEADALKVAVLDLLGVQIRFIGIIPHNSRLREASKFGRPEDLFRNNMPIRSHLMHIVKTQLLDIG